MSFSSDLKIEVINNIGESGQHDMAELSAMLALGGSVHIKSGGLGLKFSSENAAVTRRAFALVKAQTGVRCRISAVKRAKLNKGNLYVLDVGSPEEARALLEKACIIDGDFGFIHKVPRRLLSGSQSRRAYLRGAFLAAGTVADPDKAYHLEITVSDENFALSFCKFLLSLGINAKTARRKDIFIVYVKESESIVDFMSLAGASSGIFKMENARIMKNIYNNVNRAVNCDTANTEKTLAAARAQIEDIQYLIDKGKFTKLSRQLRETAEIRLEYPEASLEELGRLHAPPQSKSCVNHRLGKLRAEACRIRQEEGDIL